MILRPPRSTRTDTLFPDTPLFRSVHGEVIGINSQIFSASGGYMGVSFAIPIDLAMGAVEQLKETGRVRRGMIGVTLQEIDTEPAKGLGMPDARGELINDVSTGSARDTVRLRIGDVGRSTDDDGKGVEGGK